MTRVETLLPTVLATRLPASVAAHRLNWLVVARKDVADAARNWQLYVLIAIFSAAMLLATAKDVADPQIEGADLVFALGLESMVWTNKWLVLVVGLLVGYTAIVSERETGSLRVLLGLPITRRDVYVGKLLGRSVVFGVTLAIGLGMAAWVLWQFYADVDALVYAEFVGLTLAYGLVFVAMGVGISGVVDSHARATGAVATVFAATTVLWPQLVGVVLTIFDDAVTGPGEAEPWLVFLANLNPNVGYESLVQEWIDVAWTQDVTGLTVVFDEESQLIANAEPWYLQPGIVFAVILLWGLLPLVVGAWRFDRSDVG